MGTSKGYIPPTSPEWSKAKRAVSTFLRNRDSESFAAAVSKYAEAQKRGSGTNGKIIGASFSSAAGNIISFAKGLQVNGLDKTLHQFGRDDLIGKPPETIVNELMSQFTNNCATAEDALALEALSATFDKLQIITPDDLANVDLDAFLIELIIEFVNDDFDFRFHEKIGQGKTPEETLGILKEVHGYIDGTLRNKLTTNDIKQMNLSNMSINGMVSTMLDEAFAVCMNIYGDGIV